MFDPKGKKVTVMGLGLSGGGVGVAKWLLKHGATVTVTDLKDERVLEKSILDVASVGVPFTKILGEHRDADFTDTDLVIKNQGVPDSSPYLQKAINASVPVETDIGIFFENFPGRIVAVTGTKGKTTTTTLLQHILETSEKDLLVGGNLRKSTLDSLDIATDKTVAVLELSSFQLEILPQHKRSPNIAIWTNIYPDHLDRYEGMEGYMDAKANIFRYQKSNDALIMNGDQQELVALAKKAPGRVIFFSTEKELEEGAFVRDGEMIWKAKGTEQSIGHLSRIKIPGTHNVANVLASAAGALIAGVPIEKVREVIETFKGVENRLEFVREVNGVSYINDTASSIPTSTIAALNSFTEPIVLIAGGHDKKLPLDQLALAILTRAQKVILFDAAVGHQLHEIMTTSDQKRLKEIFAAPFAKSMQEAVTQAKKTAKTGSIVLLSPGAASFGMFQNEFDRGEQFVAAVKAL